MIAWTGIVALGLMLPSAPAAPADTLVVCPAEFRAAMEPWAKLRTEQGHRLTWLEAIDKETSAQLKARILNHAKLGETKFLVLVGDADSPKQRNAHNQTVRVPTHYIPAKVNVRFGSDPQIATDAWYADLNDDGSPDLAVGRLAVDTREELDVVVKKILSTEQSQDFGDWRRRINFVAGVGGFGQLVDSTIESMTKRLINDTLPSQYQTSMTVASWQSPYCPAPQRFSATAMERLCEGCRFWVYIGHGHRHNLDFVRTPGGDYPILHDSQVKELRCQHGAPIVLFLACSTCAFDENDCLGEQLLRHEGGPVAVIGATRVSMPYAMAVMGKELIKVSFEPDPQLTVGEALLKAKQRSLAPPVQGDGLRATIDMLAQALSPPPAELPEQRQENVYLFHLLGDPLMRLNWPSPVSLEPLDFDPTGRTVRVRGTSPHPGRMTVELMARRDQITLTQPVDRKVYDAQQPHDDYNETYRLANQRTWARSDLDVADAFETTLTVPPHARGPAQILVYVEGATSCAAGACELLLPIVDAPSSVKPDAAKD